MTWHGQINRTIWEIERLVGRDPKNHKLRRELLRTHFLQRYEFDRNLHIPRDDRSFLFMQEEPSPVCLLLHGANGTPAEMRDLGNHLYSRGLSVFCPRVSRFDVKKRLVTWESWMTLAEAALGAAAGYSDQVFLVGLSLGGTVSIILDRLHPVQALVLLAPALCPRLGVKSRLYSISRHVTPTLFYRFAGWNGEIAKAMDYVRRRPEPIKAPTLVLQALDDRVLSSKGLKLLRRWVAHPRSEVVLLSYGAHALTRGKAKDEVFDRIYCFLRDTQAGVGSS